MTTDARVHPRPLERSVFIPPVEPAQAPLLARPYYRAEGTSPIVTSLAHVPEALEVTMPFVSVVLGPSAIDSRTKELVIVRTSVLMECRYCVQTHCAVALESAVSVVEVRSLRSAEGPVEGWEREDERALLAWVDAVAGGRGGVPAAVGERLRAHYSEAETVELTLVCAATMMLNRYCTALELPTSAQTIERLARAGLA